MRHLISLLLLVAAGIFYLIGMGPLFFGAPLTGSVLLAVAIALEVAFWRRTRQPVRH